MSDEIEKYTRQHEEMSVRSRPPSILAKGSEVVRIEEQDEDGEWRSVIKMQRITFNESRKGRFLEEYRKWGRMGDAAAAAGVTTVTVRKAISKDEEFAEAVLAAENDYQSRVISHHQDLIFNGTQKDHYDRNGQLVSSETIYPIRLIELELKKVDSAYRERQEIAVNHSGGVLVAPAEMKSIADWEDRFAQKPIDITPDDA